MKLACSLVIAPLALAAHVSAGCAAPAETRDDAREAARDFRERLLEEVELEQGRIAQHVPRRPAEQPFQHGRAVVAAHHQRVSADAAAGAEQSSADRLALL